MPQLTKNFHSSEFVCPCCGQAKMDEHMMTLLQQLRDAYGKPISIIEGGGYRCEHRDGKKGAHTEGKAVDVGIPREDYYSFMFKAMVHGFTGIGVKNKGGRHQLHIDTAEETANRPRPWVWTY